MSFRFSREITIEDGWRLTRACHAPLSFVEWIIVATALDSIQQRQQIKPHIIHILLTADGWIQAKHVHRTNPIKFTDFDFVSFSIQFFSIIFFFYFIYVRQCGFYSRRSHSIDCWQRREKNKSYASVFCERHSSPFFWLLSFLMYCLWRSLSQHWQIESNYHVFTRLAFVYDFSQLFNVSARARAFAYDLEQFTLKSICLDAWAHPTDHDYAREYADCGVCNNAPAN